jgi:hypothetical protein
MEALNALRRRFSHLRSNFLPWLKRADGPAYAILGTSIGIGSGILTAPDTYTEASVHAGAALQVAGVAILAVRMGYLQEHFGKVAWWRKPLRWIQNFPFRVPKHVELSVSAEATASGSAEARVREGVPDGLEERVDRLERVVEKIEDRLHDVKADLRAQIPTVRKDLEAEKQRRKDRLDDLESSLERASVYNLKWEGIALSWLLVGPVLAGEPELLGTLLRWGL